MVNNDKQTRRGTNTLRQDSTTHPRAWRALATAMLSTILIACNSGDSASSTTVITTTAADASVAAPTTVNPTTAEAKTDNSTSSPAPEADDEENDDWLAAIERAQTAIRNCYAAAPGCDEAELDAALTGTALQGFQERSTSGKTYGNADGLTWTMIAGPNRQGDALATASICLFDPLVVTDPDGTVNDDEGYFVQEWHLVPDADTWKVSEIVYLTLEPLSAPCDG